MGASQSKYNLPSGKRYSISYSKQIDYPNTPIKSNIHINTPIENETPTDMIYSVCYRLLENMGYSPSKRYSHYQPANMNIEESISRIKIKTPRGCTSDVKIKGTSYYPSNIKKLVSDGNILIAGIVLDPHEKILNVEGPVSLENINRITDVVCVVGYSEHGIHIQTSWCNEYLIINESMVKEIWNITIENEEDTFLNIDYP